MGIYSYQFHKALGPHVGHDHQADDGVKSGPGSEPASNKGSSAYG